MQASRIAAAVAGSAVLAVTALATPAFAHVTVQPEGPAAKGGYAVVDFKVPNERDDASTTKVEVDLPAGHPLASVLAQPLDGWSVQITKSRLDKPVELHGEKITEAVTKVTWTADGKGANGKGIQPGFFQKFPLSVGALPEDTDRLVFKALQTYSDHQVVRWIEVPQAGQDEPENPAPVLELSPAASGEHTAVAVTSTSSRSGEGGDTTARVLAVAGIGVGAAGLAFGARARRRQPNT
jgi:uncharacterized protein